MIQDNLLRWHRLLAQATAALSLAIVRRRVRRELLQNTAAILRTVADEMERPE